MTKRWFAVLNPKSGGGRAARDRARIEHELKRAGIRFEIGISSYAGHAISLAADAASRGYRQFLAIGGDGTLNEVLNGALSSGELEARELSLGLIPVGRGNDWSRGRGLPRSYAAAANLLASGNVIAHDVGVITHSTDDGRAVRYFINVAGAGFDAHVVSLVQGNRFGALTYLAALPTGFATWRSPVMTISAEGHTSTGEVFVAFAAIGRYCGGGMFIAPDARPDDGLLDVVMVQDITKWELILNIRRLFDGSIASYRKVRTFRTNALDIAGPVPVATEADGELLSSTPVKMSVLGQRIHVVAP